jgi:cyanophycinase
MPSRLVIAALALPPALLLNQPGAAQGGARKAPVAINDVYTLIGNRLDVSAPVATIQRNGPPGQRTLKVDSGVLRNDFDPEGRPFKAVLGDVPRLLEAMGRLTWNANQDGGFVFQLAPDTTVNDIPDRGLSFQYTIRTTDGRVSQPAVVTIYRGTSERQDPKRAREDTRRDVSKGGLLLGGGDTEEYADQRLRPAYEWLLTQANGGDLVVLQHSHDIDLAYFWNVVRGSRVANKPRSVRLFSINARSQASLPEVLDAVANAEAIYIAGEFGGDQSKYVDFWMGTPLQAAINRAIKERNVAIAATSDGLGILGQVVFRDHPQLGDSLNLESPRALADPYTRRLVLVKDFLQHQALENVITDSHFGLYSDDEKLTRGRDRMGRLVAFLGRIRQDQWVAPGTTAKGIGVDEKTFVAVETHGPTKGDAKVIGYHYAYFVTPTRGPVTCRPGQHLSFPDLRVRKVSSAEGTFKFAQGWEAGGALGDTYTISATTVNKAATIQSDRRDPNDIY